MYMNTYKSLHLYLFFPPWGNRERKQEHTCYGSSDPKKKTPLLVLTLVIQNHVLLCRILDGNQPTITPLPYEAPLREKVVLTYTFVRPVSRCYVVSVRKKNKQPKPRTVCMYKDYIYKYKTQVEVLVDF